MSAQEETWSYADLNFSFATIKLTFSSDWNSLHLFRSTIFQKFLLDRVLLVWHEKWATMLNSAPMVSGGIITSGATARIRTDICA